MDTIIGGDVDAAARALVELATRAMACERVNAWLFNEAESELHCIACYEATPGRHSSGMVLCEPDFRNEFQALKDARYVDAHDPLTDPRTAGYVESYLKPLGITSMLDAVIRASGRNLGLLCFEHVGRPHRWTKDEIAFACQLADKLGLALLTRERLGAAERLRDSEAALAEAQAIARVGSWEFDLVRRTLRWSRETYRIFGVTRATFVPTYEAMLTRLHPDDRDRVDVDFQASVRTRTLLALDLRIVQDDGQIRHVHARGRTSYDAQGRPTRAVGTVQDITERKRIEDDQQFTNTLLRTQMETSPDAILVVGTHGRIIAANQRFADMFLTSVDRLLGADGDQVLTAAASHMKSADAFLTRLRQLHTPSDEMGHDELETTDGRYFERHTALLRTPAGTELGRVWFFREITARKSAELQILHAARHDALTGLPNRRVFVEELRHAIARVTRGAKPFAVLYLDLDYFKDVNDTLGHPVGDELLRVVAARLRATVRDTDLVARFGGDEFAVVVSEIDQPVDAAIVASHIAKAISEPCWVQESEIRLGASIGISVHGPQYLDPEMLLAHADVALYRAKAERRGFYRFFTEAMDTDVRTRVTLRSELRRAIDDGQLFLVYQPQIDLESGRITGVEALVRWRHPERGVLDPGVFIPVAEDSGLVVALSHWVLRDACHRTRAWLDEGIPLSRVSVNLSAVQFKMALELEAEIAAALVDSSLAAHYLELELTESVLMAASREHNDVLARLRANGMTLAIDDFGTGYSSLGYLRRFPVDRIKIAREFVSRILDDAGSAAIVKATISLARELGMAVIAEGVDSPAQVGLLSQWGCREAQGFFFAKPLSGDEITPLLRRGHTMSFVPPPRRRRLRDGSDVPTPSVH
ncbi:MAG: EAL domain-containing protein [Acidobacteria bacterium]|nr:EAL domain-containing protein [Acidobacteriota bacterium]